MPAEISRVLPAGVPAETLDSFFDAIAAKIGTEHVSRDHRSGSLPGPHGSESYGDPFSARTDRLPSGAVRPSSVEEVQHVVKEANNFKIPLWTVSRGRNLGGYGPGVDGLFFQSNLGIVTKLGIHMTPAPEAYAYCEVSVKEEKDLVPLIGTISDLIRRRIIGNSASISNIFRQALVSENPRVLEKLGPHLGIDKHVAYEVLEKIRAKEGWGFWKAHFALYGSIESVEGQIRTVRRALAPIENVQLVTRGTFGSKGSYLKATAVGPEEVPHAGVPSMAPLTMTEHRGPGSGHLSFSPIIPPSGREVYDWYLTAKERTEAANFDFFADFHVFGRHVLAIELFTFAHSEQDRAYKLFEQLAEDGAKQGYSEYRTHVDFMDKVASHFDFNERALQRFTTAIKDVVDPNGIISPGKSGIWNSGTV
ncbi:putative fad binding domain containing protein [Phaeomoniella chlamydospora]|uniref:Putative fad binding domain containing protein n=1 Tax=Phaeomoniella chlamydospora TaxID=158046 RepID=A0A0G2EWI0_PHACM|nr:putative fad binding domain containing protein [Phaeomoniella chlamydospora]